MDNALSPAIVVDEFRPQRRSLRIAMVTETYPPEVNGVSLSVARLVQGLRERQHELQLIRPRQQKAETPDAADRFHEVLMRGLPLPRYPHLKMGLPSKRALLSLWSRCRPDVVHIATEGPLGWSALQVATRLRLPVCSDFRTNFHAYSSHYGIGWLNTPIMAYLRRFHNRTACTMVPTEALRRELADRGFHRLSVLPRGVDTALFDPARRSAALRHGWGATDRTQVVLHVGRIAPEKNLGALVLAYEAMRRVQPDTRLVLVGDGPTRRELERRCPEAVFAGIRSGEDLATHYASGDLFLFPSITETFGNVTPEAMASGLAVLAFDHAAAGQLIRSGDNGLLAPYDDTPAFIHLAGQLAGDRSLQAVLGAKARESVADLGWDRIVHQLEGVFTGAIHAAPMAERGTVLQPRTRLS